ncbi:PAS domain-containing sensor histidine kinase [Rhizobium sp. TRM95111]|uniref:sensor histidine kinase n=1 Tax=Rhizobium alarense TaxID=2846851 RepID=UPI001F2D07B8|nr:PAS domain-containing sensor histidine kinase [Rhizobium alarense]MCF3638544.1 PAS domain-containing sensor histidine kinase [Rhizobium alarense]
MAVRWRGIWPDLFVGLICITLGSIVLGLWLAGARSLVATYPSPFLMQFNTALCFVASGLAFILSAGAMPRLAIALAAAVWLFCMLTLLQYPLGVNIGIDTLFLDPVVRPASGAPGRMGANSAICFILVSSGIATRAATKRNTRLQAGLGFVAGTIAAVALTGYLIDLDRAYAWSRLARMSPSIAICFVALGTGLVFIGPRSERHSRGRLVPAAAIITYFALLTFSLLELRRPVSTTALATFDWVLSVRTTVTYLLLTSGIIYIALIAYSQWNARRYRRTLDDLEGSEARLAAIIGNAVDGIVTIDRNGTILSANPACERIFGYRNDEMIGRNVKMLMPEPYHSAHDGYVANYNRTGEAKVIGIGREVEGRRKDGSVFPLDLAVAKVDLVDGVIYSGVVRDISERKAMIRDLADSRERFAAVIDNAVDGIISIDAAGTIRSANPACERIFGYRNDEMIGRNVKMLMPEPYHSAHDGYVANYNRTGEAKVIGIGREVEGRRKDGSVFPLDLAVAKVELGDGILYSGIVRDISERKRYEQELIEANTELEEFAYRTSHDLRSPIASSLGLIGIAQDLLKDGAHGALEGTLERMEKNFRRQDHLIQNIIVLTRNRLLDEAAQPIRVHEVVRETLESLSHLDHFGRLSIANHVGQELTIVNKPSKFQIVIGNMISNAIKYHDPQETAPTIEIRAERSNGTLCISVEDNGIGIPAESRHQLFRMFKRLHPNRAFGSGLGLYILKKSAESLGGRVLYEPREKGSRFAVELPEKGGA